MNSFSRLGLTAAVALAAALQGQAKVERDVERTFQVTGAGTLRLETSGGAIRVVPGPAGIVKIVAHERIRADSDAEADKLLKNLDLTFEQDGGNVRASAKYQGGSSWLHFGPWPPVQVDFIATVPASYAADLRTSGGGITVGDLSGAVSARTSGGPIELGKLGGPVDAWTSGGGITLEAAEAETHLGTSGGPITVGRIAGTAELRTSGGNIDIRAVEQAVQARTSGGSIRATLVGPLKGDCLFSTSGGGIHVTVGKAAAFRLDAKTSGGAVDASGLVIALDGSEGHGRSSLVGEVNGGGPLVKLRTSGGNIGLRVR